MKITLTKEITKEQIFNYYGFQSYLDNPQIDLNNDYLKSRFIEYMKDLLLEDSTDLLSNINWSFEFTNDEFYFVNITELIEYLEKTYFSINKINLSQKDKHIRLHLLEIKKDFRRKKFGTYIMHEICDYADKNNCIITLTPTNEFGTSLKVLNKFYKKFNFIKNTDYSITDSLIRFPQ